MVVNLFQLWHDKSLMIINHFISKNSAYSFWFPNYHDRTWRLSWLFIDHDRAWILRKSSPVSGRTFCNLETLHEQVWSLIVITSQEGGFNVSFFGFGTVNDMDFGAFIFPLYKVYICVWIHRINNFRTYPDFLDRFRSLNENVYWVTSVTLWNERYLKV